MHDTTRPQDLLACTPEEAGVAKYLSACQPELAASFYHYLPAARQAVLQRLLQGALRENIANLREHTEWIPARSCLRIVLNSETWLRAPVVRPLSLDRWDFGTPIVATIGDRQHEIAQATDLFDLLCATVLKEHGLASTGQQRFRWELDNSTANYALAMAGAERRRRKLVEAAAEAGCQTSLEWTAHCANADPDFSSLIFFEQWVIDGHPLHPGTKLKGGMAPDDVVRYSPEWEARPEVRIAAVRKHLCQVSSCASAGPAAVLRREYPDLGCKVDAYLTQLGCRPADFEWIPVHPWQAEQILPDMFASEIERRELLIVPSATLPTAALMAVRSLAPVGPSSRGKHHLKTAIHVQTTGAIRTVSPQAAANGPMVANLLAEVQRREQGFSGRLVVLLEPVGIYFDDADTQSSTVQRELRSKNLSAILRENPEAYVHEGEIAMPASALLARSPLSGTPIVAELLKRCGRCLGVEAQQAVIPFLRAYAKTTVPGMLTLMSRYGIGLEGHLQNCVMVFRDGWPMRVLVRDMGGVRVLPQRLSRQGLEVQFHAGSATLAADLDDLRNKVGYAFLQNHWGELIACLARHFDSQERSYWEPLAERCAVEFRLLADDPQISAQARSDAAALFRTRVPLKALATMRLHGDVTRYSFSDVANPLADFADQLP